MKNKLIIKPDTDLIKRGDAENAIRKACVVGHAPMSSKSPEGKRTLEALRAINKVDAVDAVPVVHGRWIRLKNEKGKLFPWYQCSKCGCSPAYWENELPPYCHCCGANMKGADKQNESNT